MSSERHFARRSFAAMLVSKVEPDSRSPVARELLALLQSDSKALAAKPALSDAQCILQAAQAIVRDPSAAASRLKREAGLSDAALGKLLPRFGLAVTAFAADVAAADGAPS